MVQSYQCSCGESYQIDLEASDRPKFCHRCGSPIALATPSPPPAAMAPPPPVAAVGTVPPPPPRAGGAPPPPPPPRTSYAPPPPPGRYAAPLRPAAGAGYGGANIGNDIAAAAREMLGVIFQPDVAIPRLLQHRGLILPGIFVVLYLAVAIGMTMLGGLTSFKILLVVFLALTGQALVMAGLVFAGAAMVGPRDRISFVTACNAVCTALIPLTLSFLLGGLLSRVGYLFGAAVGGYLAFLSVLNLITALRFMGLSARGSIQTTAVTVIVGALVLGIVVAIMADTLAGGMSDSMMDSSDSWGMGLSDQQALDQSLDRALQQAFQDNHGQTPSAW